MKQAHYQTLQSSWPAQGRHILAYFDATTLYVYQAYRPAIADHAVSHQRFGGEFSFGRMSWIKPNFLWMMYRSGWASKEGQERILAVRLNRSFFDELLRAAVPSSHEQSTYPSRQDWAEAVKSSEVRLQWDPDHDPAGRPLERRALQLGLRGHTLQRYATDEIVSITDMTDFVIEQRNQMMIAPAALLMPEEHVYIPGEAATGRAPQR
jgi:Domain of unknown function (DUF4291)